VFSFHATKFINSFEGGAVVTNDHALADRLRLMRNFGFAGYDNVIYVGTNGKMTEICAAMGLTSLESMREIVDLNKRHYEAYREGLAGIPGLTQVSYAEADNPNYQYIVIEVDPGRAGLTRDDLVSVLHAENVLARKYFWPGCHRMEPYRSLQPDACLRLPQTENLAERIMLLPTGQSVSHDDILKVCAIIRTAMARAAGLRVSVTAAAPN
jgi:dTDP-4-amino-4,6-dideoxygalactose transaminase